MGKPWCRLCGNEGGGRWADSKVCFKCYPPKARAEFERWVKPLVIRVLK